MTSTLPVVATALRSAVRGNVLVAADPAYDGARRVWNGLVDRYPAVIARCVDTADVVAAVRSWGRTTRNAPERPSARTCPSR
ncbi:hypothetical protein FHS29_000939 [Saccharothrix tamanrassetensis]|uniref:Uncharacterized protein n=1 Tax=Saccharothrix tamanrassetensis TaxID=1051531 RepID=A0A841CAD9_9PSEU|nr:hypothetical protein [Saccharothrix tamanrassetensis]MBB5954369.1 hypothetical protein [Saccharothrix tamanrassetensis]